MFFNVTADTEVTDMVTCTFSTKLSYPDLLFEQGTTDDILPKYMVDQFMEMGVEYFNFVDSVPKTKELFYLTDGESEALAKFFRHFRQSPVNRFYNEVKKKFCKLFNDDTVENQEELIREYLGQDELDLFYDDEDERYYSLWELLWHGISGWNEWAILEVFQARYDVDLEKCDLSPYLYDLATGHRNACGILTAVLKDGRTIRFVSKDQKGKALLFNVIKGNGYRFHKLIGNWSTMNVPEEEELFVEMNLNPF